MRSSTATDEPPERGPTDAGAKPRLGVSACLLGRQVRFDGGHKRQGFLVETFGRFVEWVEVCPELELGLGVPRDTLRLERGPDRELRLVMPRRERDYTDEMRAFAKRRVAALEPLGLSGYVLKKGSPSCGLERVKVYRGSGSPQREGRGLFAQALLERFPLLPVEEEGRLEDPRLREGFVERVFAHGRLAAFFAGRWSQAGLVRFHTAHKLLVMAHSVQAYGALGRLVAEGRQRARAELRALYSSGLMQALARPATPRTHANVLQHMLGYLRAGLTSADRAELVELIDRHRRGLLPLVVPLTLLRHHVRRLGVAYLAGQIYLDPHPRELQLRNHV